MKEGIMLHNDNDSDQWMMETSRGIECQSRLSSDDHRAVGGDNPKMVWMIVADSTIFMWGKV